MRGPGSQGDLTETERKWSGVCEKVGEVVVPLCLQSNCQVHSQLQYYQLSIPILCTADSRSPYRLSGQLTDISHH